MFISDFAIKRPIITITSMVALVVFGLVALMQPADRRVPRHPQPIVAVTIVYPGASPDDGGAGDHRPHRGGHLRHQRRGCAKTTSSATDGLAQFTVFFDFEKDVQEATQDIRDAISGIRARPAAGDGGADPHAVRSDGPAHRLAGAHLGHAARRPSSPASPTRGSRASCARSAAWPQVTVIGGIERELTVELKPGGAAGGGAERGAGGAGACSRRTWPRRWAGSPARWTSARSASRAGWRRPRTSCNSWSPSADGQLIRLGAGGAGEGRHGGAAHAGALQRQAGGRHRHQEVEGLQHHRRGGPGAARGWRSSRPTLPEGVAARRSCATRATRVAASVRNVQEALIEGAAAHGAGGVPVPQLVALDGDHRPGAAGVGAGVVHRGVGVRLHAQHDVAARPLAGHRHPDRRRHRGAREHRAPRRDGEGPLHGRRARAPTRSASRWRRRPSRSSRCSSRSRFMYGVAGPVVQAVRAHHRLLGAGVALRVASRSTRCCRPTGPIRTCRGAARRLDHADARPLQPLVRPAGRGLQARDRLGAGPPAGDGARWPSARSSARWRCRRMFGGGGLRAGERQRARWRSSVETPPGSNLDYTRLKAEEVVAHRARAPGGGLHLHPRSARRCRALAGRGPGARSTCG